MAKMVIEKPSLTMKAGEVCFYEGTAKSYRFVTKTVKEKPKKSESNFKKLNKGLTKEMKFLPKKNQTT